MNISWRDTLGTYVSSAMLVHACACSSGDGGGTSLSAGIGSEGSAEHGSTTGPDASTSGGTGDADASADTSASVDDGPNFDVGPDLGDPTPPFDACSFDDLAALEREGAPPGCSDSAPPDSFEPELLWSFAGPDDAVLRTTVIPLVGNFTDDNADGAVDLCDTPDVVLLAGVGNDCDLYLLDGATGEIHLTVDGAPIGLSCQTTPAFADLDGEGPPEIVVNGDDAVAIRADGTVAWSSPVAGFLGSHDGAFAIHDLDADGSSEILFGHQILAATGESLWLDDTHYSTWPMFLKTPTAADLDGDGELELVVGHAAYDLTVTDGVWTHEVLWDHYADGDPLIPPTAQPHIANFIDDEPNPAAFEPPEILLATEEGLVLLDASGAILWGPWADLAVVGPCGTPTFALARPGAVLDVDADGHAELVVSQCSALGVYEIEAVGPSLAWSSPVQDYSGASGATAFDFLGDGIDELVYSDEIAGYAFSGLDEADGWSWEIALSVPRSSGTEMEFPVVADIDDDGDAEFLVVSSDGVTPALQVFGDDDWIQARRIWNQHAYHVTNIRENGTVPTVQPRNWDYFNTYRVNAPIEAGVPCDPAG